MIFAEMSPTGWLNLGAAGVIGFVVVSFIKVLKRVLLYMREDRRQMDSQCREHHQHVEDFTRVMGNHIEHQTQATDALTDAVKELTRIVRPK